MGVPAEDKTKGGDWVRDAVGWVRDGVKGGD